MIPILRKNFISHPRFGSKRYQPKKENRNINLQWYPEAARLTATQGAEVLIYPNITDGTQKMNMVPTNHVG
jgi:tyrosine-protein phosphatase YwqE